MTRHLWPSLARLVVRRISGRAERNDSEQLNLVKKHKTSLRNGYGGTEASNGEQDTTFMTRYMVQKVLKREDIRELLHTYRWYHDSQLESIYSKFIRIIATLITIEWTEWADFDRLFLSHKNGDRYTRCDDQLPFRSTSDLGFFSPQEAWRRFFHLEQFVYSPIVLKENDHSVYRADQRLPFLKCEERSRGGYGVVFRVVVQKYQIEYARHRSPNHEKEVMALKVIRDERSFKNERAINEGFKKGFSSCEVILLSFGSFEHGSTLNILYPWAELNLAELLAGDYDCILERGVKLTPHALVSQLHQLSHGIHFMHNELYVNGPKKCSHLDLKPDNILIFLGQEDRRSDAQGSKTVMHWKIADFGLSALLDRDESQNRVGGPAPGTFQRSSMIEHSSLPAPRPPGPFQAPEMQAGSTVNRSTDMWSFGCISCDVFAFILGGPLEEHKLFLQRKRGYVNDYFWTTGADDSFVVKPEVEEWLSLQEAKWGSESSLGWIRRAMTLVRKLLQIDKSQRLQATKTRAELLEILGMTEELSMPWTLPPVSDLTELRQSYPDSFATDKSNFDAMLLEDQTPSHEKWVPQPSDAARPQLQPKSRLERLFPYHLKRSDTILNPDLARRVSWPAPPTSAQYYRVSVPSGTFQSVLSADAGCVSFCSDDYVYLYDLCSILEGSDLFMPDERQCLPADGPAKLASFRAPITHHYTSVLLAGPYVGLQMVSHRQEHSDRVEIYKRSGALFQMDPIAIIPLGPGCLEANLSARGGLMLMYEHKLDICLLDPIRLQALELENNQKLMSATFSPDGLSIGAWYITDNRDQWCMWEVGTDNITRKQWQYAPRNRADIELNTMTTNRRLIPGTDSHTFIAFTNSGQLYFLNDHGREKLDTCPVLCPGAYAAVYDPQSDALLLLCKEQDGHWSHVDLVRMISDNGDLQDRVKRVWFHVDKHSHGIAEGLVLFTNPGQSGFLTSFVDGFLVKQPFPHDVGTVSDKMEI